MVEVLCDLPDGDFGLKVKGDIRTLTTDCLYIIKSVYNDIKKKDGKLEANEFKSGVLFMLNCAQETIFGEEHENE